MKLKHKIQDLINNGKIVVGNHTTNSNHKYFKDPFPTYDQEDSSKSKGGAKVNYTCTNEDHMINILEPSQSKHCNVIIVKEDQNKLRTTNVITHAQGKVTLKGVGSSYSN